MEGMARAASRQFDVAIVTAWHTARFALNGYADKGRLAGENKLSDLLSSAKRDEDDDHRLQDAKIIHALNSLKARGVPIEITRTVN